MVCGPKPIRYHVRRPLQRVTVSETRMGQPRYTEFMTLPPTPPAKNKARSFGGQRYLRSGGADPQPIQSDFSRLRIEPFLTLKPSLISCHETRLQ